MQMSRIGKKPVVIPGGVQVSLKDSIVAVKGPKGELKRSLPEGVKVQVDKTAITVARDSDEPSIRARHGLVRALLNNMIEGVTKGFERKLEINGVGYKAEIAGDKVNLALGYSHPIAYQLPKGVTAKVEKNLLTLAGIDRELLGQTAAKVRSFRPPEPYKGKGVKYIEETIKRKVGKTGAA
jgi:large subunit ribosomal protein L6